MLQNTLSGENTVQLLSHIILWVILGANIFDKLPYTQDKINHKQVA